MEHFILDFSTVAWRIQNNLPKTVVDDFEQYVSVCWELYLNGFIPPLNRYGYEMPSEFYLTVACDKKYETGNYWRNEEIVQEYKGTRAPKPEELSKIFDIGFQFVDALGVQKFSFDGYEADDIIGAFVRNKIKYNQDHQTYIWTCDSDLLQLVTDTHKVTWVNTQYYSPLIRDEQTSLDYLTRRFSNSRNKFIFGSVRDVVIFKHLYGDKSDNLEKRDPIDVIDLLNPPPSKNLEKLVYLPSSTSLNLGDIKILLRWLQMKEYPF